MHWNDDIFNSTEPSEIEGIGQYTAEGDSYIGLINDNQMMCNVKSGTVVY